MTFANANDPTQPAQNFIKTRAKCLGHWSITLFIGGSALKTTRLRAQDKHLALANFALKMYE